MAYIIHLDEGKCGGCGACPAVCSNFEMMENGKARVKNKEVKEIGCNQEAADACPRKAITIRKVR
ncbi:ferredoxin [Candidatus Woesearchaeota archaeon]|nr:ferredoxin [Candidatus Woesearchaeota archaeon]